MVKDPQLVRQNLSVNSTIGLSTKDSSECVHSKDSSAYKEKKKKDPLLDYTELDMIGFGSFGRVVKVQKKKDQKQYAMKVIDKKKIEKVNIHFFYSLLPK